MNTKLKQHFAIAALAFLMVYGCSKDKGNYVYDNPEEITIKGLDANLNAVALVDSLKINPEVISTDAAAEFSYWWGIYRTGSSEKIDTISRNPALKHFVTQQAGIWNLVFAVKNKHTGYTKVVRATLNVNTTFTRGWYVMKDEGGKTDMDFFLTPGSILPASRMENVYSLVNHKKLDGAAGRFGFCTDYGSDISGRVVPVPAIFLLSGQDASFIEVSSLKEINDFSGLLYEEPLARKPVMFGYAGFNTFFVNDGQIHSMISRTTTRRFGAKHLWDSNNTPYYLSKYFLMNNTYASPLFYDEIHSSFISATGSFATLVPIKDLKGTEMNANNTNKEMLFMGIKSPAPFLGTAVFRDKTDRSLYILSHINASGGTAISIQNDTLSAADKLTKATQFGLIIGDENMLYFSIGNEVWSRNLSNGVEKLQFTAGIGEEVSFIRHLKYNPSAPQSEQPFFFNYMLVGTTNGTGYKVRAFQKESGNLKSVPDFVLEGKGRPGDVIYISPMLTNDTYFKTN